MQANEFEKKVQDKMGSFGLDPSSEVWHEVERRIRKERKRRFIFWWFIGVMAIGGGMAGYFILTKKDRSVVITETGKKQISNDQSSKITITPGGETTTSTPVNTINKNTANERQNVVGEKTVQSAHPPAIAILPKKKRVEEEKKNRNTRIVRSAKTTKETRPVSQIKKVNDQKTEEDLADSRLMETTASLTVADAKAVITPTDTTTARQETMASIKNETIKPGTPDTVAAEKTIASSKKKKNEWDISIQLSAGRSSLVEGLHRNELLYASPPLGLGSADQRDRGLLRPSFSTSIHGIARKKLSEKLDLRLGLGYLYLSTRMNTGEKVDSSRYVSNAVTPLLNVNNFYRRGQSQTYSNNFHFVQLSAELSWKIVDSKKFKLSWDNGISYNRLLGSSMLHYSSSLPGYYVDNRLLNKNQLSLSTGFTIPLSNRVQVNPFVLYNLTPVLKDNSAQGARFLNYGIRVRFGLNKN